MTDTTNQADAHRRASIDPATTLTREVYYLLKSIVAPRLARTQFSHSRDFFDLPRPTYRGLLESGVRP